ncbi:transcriptional regulator [Nonomuraea aridisoli]|uniref:transcriptional regulator n=1 Tax=Nonomuraea aridisoli TaxID=2070368 RepID=UPI0015E87B67|nr:transcriptional regulator [Nonomuraea aridisoli]
MERHRSRIAIGVAGPHDLVERIVHVGAGLPTAATFRLVSVPHDSRIIGGVDVVLFTGPLQYDLARQAGELDVPATYVPVNGAGLYAALLRGALGQGVDPARVSIDSIAPDEVAEAYDEIGLPTAGVHVCEYRRPDSVRGFAGFHERLHRQGATTAALTTVRTVATRLTAGGVPVLRMTPAASTVRRAIDTAALLGAGNRAQESQIAIALVSPVARPGPADPGDYRQQELRLLLHRSLLADARLMGAMVVPREEHAYALITTAGALSRVTDGFRTAPFVGRVRAEVGLDVVCGLGLGGTARDADAHAAAALDRARAAGTAAYLVDGDGVALPLPAHGRAASREARGPGTVAEPGAREPGPRSGRAPGSRAVRIRDRLVERLGPGCVVVDAETVAEILGLAPRSARRVLQHLVEEGLAWALPPVRSTRAGRPRQPYRLITR